MQEKDSKSNTSNSTALVLMNTRNIEGYQSIDDMLNTKKSNGPWGNRISFLHVPIPKLNETRISNPLEFIHDTHNIINRKEQSLALALTGTLLDIEGKLRGQEVAGWTQVYGDILTFGTIRGAGHSTPLAQPERSLEMMKAFWKGKPLPKRPPFPIKD